MDKIKYLESPKNQAVNDVVADYDHPSITQHLNNIELSENETARFECRVEPSKDPSLQIDIQLNGEPLPSGSKFEISSDFGLVRLNIKDVLPRDTGVIKVVATNTKGSCSTSGTLKIVTPSEDVSNTLHPSGESGLEAIINLEKSNSMKLFGLNDDHQEIITAPHFVMDLPQQYDMDKNNVLQLNCQVEPRTDPALIIDWFHNGEPLTSGSRIKPTFDFGYVSLTMDDFSARDEGVYTCKATNKLGEASTFSKVVLKSDSKLGVVDTCTVHPQGEEGLNSINKMEAKMKLPDRKDEEVVAMTPPKFVTSFGDHEFEQGAVGHFEASLMPRDDGDMTIEWLFNGKPLRHSSRFKHLHDFGLVIFEIFGIRELDEGEYTCVATNKAGQAQTSFNIKYLEKTDQNMPTFTTQLQVVRVILMTDEVNYINLGCCQSERWDVSTL